MKEQPLFKISEEEKPIIDLLFPSIGEIIKAEKIFKEKYISALEEGDSDLTALRIGLGEVWRAAKVWQFTKDRDPKRTELQ